MEVAWFQELTDDELYKFKRCSRQTCKQVKRSIKEGEQVPILRWSDDTSCKPKQCSQCNLMSNGRQLRKARGRGLHMDFENKREGLDLAGTANARLLCCYDSVRVVFLYSYGTCEYVYLALRCLRALYW